MPKKNKQKNIRRRRLAEATAANKLRWIGADIEEFRKQSFLDPPAKLSPNLVFVRADSPGLAELPHLVTGMPLGLDVLGDLHIGLMTESPPCTAFADKSIQDLLRDFVDRDMVPFHKEKT